MTTAAKPASRVKQHLKENKRVYIAVGVSVAVTAAVCVPATYFLAGSRQLTIIDGFKALDFRWNSPTNIQNVNTMAPPGHRGNGIEVAETGERYASQNQAAQALGVSRTVVSQHINGKRENINGKHLINLAENLEPRK